MSFVKDVWFYGLGLLHEHLLPNATISDQLRVADFVDNSGGWDWNALHSLFSKDVLEYIAGIHPPKDELGKDVCLWKGLESCWYSKWKCLWDIPIALTTKHFTWLLRHGKLLTNSERARRRMTDDAAVGEVVLQKKLLFMLYGTVSLQWRCS